MKGMVECTFVGGPNEGTMTLPAMYCRDQIAIRQQTWIAGGPEGKAVLLTDKTGQTGPHMTNEAGNYIPWVAYAVAIYNKVKPVKPGNVIYQFDRTEMRDRCEQTLAPKVGRAERRCRNDALSGSSFCRAHQPKS